MMIDDSKNIVSGALSAINYLQSKDECLIDYRENMCGIIYNSLELISGMFFEMSAAQDKEEPYIELGDEPCSENIINDIKNYLTTCNSILNKNSISPFVAMGLRAQTLFCIMKEMRKDLSFS
jgi:hypothetical protein